MARSPLLLPVLLSAALLGCKGGVEINTDDDYYDAYERAADYSEERDGDALLVWERGRLVFQSYQNGWDGRDDHPLMEGTKAFSCAIFAAAAQDGLLRPEETVADTLGEWRSQGEKGRINIRQLITQSSGLAPGETGSPPSYADAVNAPLEAPPGTRFGYGPVPYQVFGELMERKLAPTGESLAAYVERRIFGPLQLEMGHWRRDADGHLEMDSGLSLTAEEWGRFGLLLEQEGMWDGRRLLDWQWLEECTSGSSANPVYGIGLYLVRHNSGFDHTDNVPSDTYFAHGARGQRLYVVPSLHRVAVRLGDDREWNDADFLEILLADEGW